MRRRKAPSKKGVKTVGKLARRRKVSHPLKEAKRRNPRPKKVCKLVRRREKKQSLSLEKEA